MLRELYRHHKLPHSIGPRPPNIAIGNNRANQPSPSSAIIIRIAGNVLPKVICTVAQSESDLIFNSAVGDPVLHALAARRGGTTPEQIPTVTEWVRGLPVDPTGAARQRAELDCVAVHHVTASLAYRTLLSKRGRTSRHFRGRCPASGLRNLFRPLGSGPDSLPISLVVPSW